MNLMRIFRSEEGGEGKRRSQRVKIAGKAKTKEDMDQSDDPIAKSKSYKIERNLGKTDHLGEKGSVEIDGMVFRKQPQRRGGK